MKNTNKPKENFVAIDTSDLTPEEYGKYVRGELTTEELIEKGRIHVWWRTWKSNVILLDIWTRRILARLRRFYKR